VLLRSIFQMGIPVSGKNMFPVEHRGPSYVVHRPGQQQGVHRPKEGDRCPRGDERETAKEDVLTLTPGAAVIYDEPLKLKELRSDLIFYPVPFDKLIPPSRTTPSCAGSCAT
jgi:2-oxoglutarate ferredoxin oxidoreductase subunit alpha